MFTSIRSRLWLSYALVVSLALGVVSLVLLVYLIRNPLIYRQESAKLLVVQNILLGKQDSWAEMPPEDVQHYFDQIEESYGVRVVLYDPSRKIIADSGNGESTLFRRPRFSRIKLSNVLRDSEGNPWLYMRQQLDNKTWLVVAVKQPDVPFQAIIRDDLLLPILGAGMAALLLSLILAYLLSRWVGDPLQTVVVASQEMPDGNVKALKAEGPREVQNLIRVFNDMSSRIIASRQSQRQFVADVSHELKTPITVIQGFAQAIMDGTADTQETRNQAAKMIFDESGRMHRLVLDLLDLAKLDTGTMLFRFDAVDITLLLEHAVEQFSPRAQIENIHLEYSSKNLPIIYGDSDRLAQVLTNLLENALKFTPPGGSVMLSAENDASRLRIDVSDTGVGIPEDDLQHIFDRFYQADPSRKGGDLHGSGLGLAIVREIVLAHHGTITARSIPGKGSTFSVFLPLASPDASTVVKRRNPK